ncbi:class V lanthionine synthetase subunit LxmK [Streptomyces brasiliscabiei]|uniref:class V lanthionine synthetase subunit LxmK n=1 Tax=Streptomyces brasiliscabiei TaxID=2736302 RepID=UPI001C100552|nr:class V lanthionine synthetase subunit LxmK [Streptomyces brasiliscabiei]
MWQSTLLLERLGLGSLTGDKHEFRTGRNENRVGVTSTGCAVFVKRLDSEQRDSVARFRRMVLFEEFAVNDQGDGLSSPPCLGWGEEELTIVFAWLKDAHSGAELARDERLTDELAQEMGRTVGTLHALSLESLSGDSEDLPLMPPLEMFEALPRAYYTRASGASLEAWRLLQNDQDLIAGLRRLRDWESSAERVPAHCDLRLDQFLIQGERVHLCDWEEFRLADPARDIGGFVGEWLYRAVLEIPAQLSTLGDQLTHRRVIESGTRELERLRSKNSAFWAGYRRMVAVSDPNLAIRATAFAGWHLIDRMLAGAERRPLLTAAERAAAGIGRTAVLNPARFTEILGLRN